MRLALSRALTGQRRCRPPLSVYLPALTQLHLIAADSLVDWASFWFGLVAVAYFVRLRRRRACVRPDGHDRSAIVFRICLY